MKPWEREYKSVAPWERDYDLSEEDMQSIAEQDLLAMDGPNVAVKPKEERTAGDTFLGILETIGTAATGATTGVFGQMLGTAQGLADSFADGSYFEGNAPETVANRVNRASSALTYEPKTEAGKEYVQNVGEALEPLAPLEAAIPELAGITRYPGAVATTMRRASDATSNAVEPLIPRTEPMRGIGAADTDATSELAMIANKFGFEGDSAPSVGQLTREADQLRFENEVMKADEGARLQDNRTAQQRQLGVAMDEMADAYANGVRFGSDDDQGRAVKQAVSATKEAARQEKNRLYQQARDAGEMSMLVTPETLKDSGLVETLQEAWRYEGTIKPNRGVYNEAKRLNIIDDDGNLKPVNADTLENFRKFVNNSYDITNPIQARQRGQFVGAIDKAMDSIDAGPAYRTARQFASKYYDEFMNSPIASRLTNNVRGKNLGLDEAKVMSTIYNSSNDAIDQIATTLNKTPEGAAQWGAIQGRFVEDLTSSLFGTQLSEGANPTRLATPATFVRKVDKLSKSGKLEKVLGKKGAEDIEDMSILVQRLMTSPPGTANHSNTAMAIFQKLKQLGSVPLRGARNIGGFLPLVDVPFKQADKLLTKRKVNKALDTKGLLNL